jgi:undecaprenyl-diphosphatase
MDNRSHEESATLKAHLKRAWEWLARRDVTTLVILAIVAGGIWTFAEIADEVVEGDVQSFDERILLAMRNPDDVSDPIGSTSVEELGRDFTSLGGVGVITAVTLVVVGYLLLVRKSSTALFLVIAIASGAAIMSLLKDTFDRPRPMLVPHGSYVASASFPSGHSMVSMVTYLTLAVLLGTLVERRRVRVYILLVAITLVIIIGVSRVYLGVHWPSDVLAGWTGGAVWALLAWQVARWFQQRGEMAEESEAERSQR